ncbi:MAG: DUF6442 family protein [Clostridia bacterium]|nr:DUF6442 family protein [Clostridia bacterium]
MDKEEILEKSRKENKSGDEREKSLINYAFAISAVVGIVVCAVIYVIHIVILRELNYSIFLVFCSIYFAYTVILAIKLKKKLYIISSVSMCVALAGAISSYIINLLTLLA